MCEKLMMLWFLAEKGQFVELWSSKCKQNSATCNCKCNLATYFNILHDTSH